MISIKVNIAGALAGLQNYRANVIPAAAARALNDTAYAAQSTLIAELPSRMRFRTGTGWLKYYFKVLKATEHDLTAYFFTTLDWMRFQEIPGTKYPHRGPHFAVPLGDLKLRKIPENMRPKFLLGEQGSISYNVPRKSGVRRRQKYLSTYNKGFLMEHGGHLFIVQRLGPKQLAFRYILVPSVRMGLNRLRMVETTRRVVAQQFPSRFRATLAAMSAGASK